MKPTPAKRGRPRTFDDAVVIERATRTFLQHGYSGASLEALATAMGMSKPSVYGAFGDKRALFLRAVDALATRAGRRIRAAFGRADTLEGSLREVFLEAVDIYVDGGAPPGCLIVSGTATEALVDEGLAQYSRDFFARADQAIAKWIRERRPNAVEPDGVSSLLLGRMVNGVIHDIALRARIGTARAELRDYARGAAIVIGRAAE